MGRQRRSITRCYWMPFSCHFSSLEHASSKSTPTLRLVRFNSTWPALPHMTSVRLQRLVALNSPQVSLNLRAFSESILFHFVELRWARMSYFRAYSSLTSQIASAHACSKGKSLRFKITSSLWSTVGHSLAPFQTVRKWKWIQACQRAWELWELHQFGRIRRRSLQLIRKPMRLSSWSRVKSCSLISLAGSCAIWRRGKQSRLQAMSSSLTSVSQGPES